MYAFTHTHTSDIGVLKTETRVQSDIWTTGVSISQENGGSVVPELSGFGLTVSPIRTLAGGEAAPGRKVKPNEPLSSCATF